jgi:hypothetical protein
MRRSTALLALVLVLLGAVAPLAEAMTGCVTGCPDDDAAGHCGDATCCSCCVYAAPAIVPAPALGADAAPSTVVASDPISHPLSVDPKDLLQVPKAGRV